VSKIYDIASAVDFEDETSRETALRELRDISNLQLRSVAMIPEESLAGVWKIAAVLAREELARRSDDEVRKLAKLSTLLAAGMGILGVCIGAILTAWLDDGHLLPKAATEQSTETN
jgi:hypothetical protein